MIVKYWGVRGSIASPGEKTLRYGGDTPCVSVEIGDAILVLDAGTGIRALGRELTSSDKDIYCLVSHLHLDHVRGFPFFDPLYQPGRTVTLLPFVRDGVRWYPNELMDELYFPRSWKSLPSNLVLAVDEPEAFFTAHPFDVKTFRVNHPGGAVGFLISDGSTTFVHVPDNELDEAADVFPELEAAVASANILSHDAQWIDNDLPMKEGWGHSSVVNLCRFAAKTDIDQLIIFHHDPDRLDDELDEIGRRASIKLESSGIKCTVAYQGLEIDTGVRVV